MRSTTEKFDNVALRLRNGRATDQRIHVTISTGTDVVFDTNATLSGGGRDVLGTGIDERGQYELRVTVDDGPNESFPFSIDGYALRQGSDLIVEIRDDDLRIMIEE